MSKVDKKLILFDWGEVLIECDNKTFSFDDSESAIAEHINSERRADVLEMFNSTRAMTLQSEAYNNYLNERKEILGCKMSIDNIKSIYLEYSLQIGWYDTVVEFVNKLTQDSRVQVGILSNLCELDAELIRSRVDVNNMDFLFYSFNLGIAKPEKQIYRVVEEVTGKNPHNILYFDDKRANVEMAKSMGWNAVMVTGKAFDTIQSACREFMKS